jgi:hypothetical protein
MKARFDFVTNSSSTAYMITNKTNHKKTLVDFVKENPELIEQFIEEYLDPRFYDKKYIKGFTQEKLIKSAKENNLNFPPNQQVYCVFGDEQETLVGRVFDYILRDGGSSKSFSWRLEEYLR